MMMLQNDESDQQVLDLGDKRCRQVILKRCKRFLNTPLKNIKSFECVLKNYILDNGTHPTISDAVKDIFLLLVDPDREGHLRDEVEELMGALHNYMPDCYKIPISIEFPIVDYAAEQNISLNHLSFQRISRTTTFSQINLLPNNYFDQNLEFMDIYIKRTLNQIGIHHAWSALETYMETIVNEWKPSLCLIGRESYIRATFQRLILSPFVTFLSKLARKIKPLDHVNFIFDEEYPVKLKMLFKPGTGPNTEEFYGREDLMVNFKSRDYERDFCMEFKSAQKRLDLMDQQVSRKILAQIMLYMAAHSTRNYIVSNYVHNAYVEIPNNIHANASITFHKDTKAGDQDLMLENEINVFRFGAQSDGDTALSTQIFMAIRVFDLMKDNITNIHFAEFPNYRNFDHKSQEEKSKWNFIQNNILHWKFGNELSIDDEEGPHLKRLKHAENTQGVHSRTRSKDTAGASVYDTQLQNQVWCQISIAGNKYIGSRDGSSYKFTTEDLRLIELYQNDLPKNGKPGTGKSILVEGFDFFHIAKNWKLNIFQYKDVNMKPMDASRETENRIKASIGNFERKKKILNKIQQFNISSSRKIRIPKQIKTGYALWIINKEYKNLGPFMAFDIPIEGLRFKPLTEGQAKDLEIQIRLLHTLGIHHNNLKIASLYCEGNRTFIINFDDATYFTECDYESCSDYLFLKTLKTAVSALNH